jgi:tetratricopeptide (TPR) repeat protein
VFALVALAAVLASGVVVVGVLATRGHVPAPPEPRPGHPSLALDLGVRTDPEARALDQAQRLYGAKQYAKARAIFDRYDSLEAQVGAAMADWPRDTVTRLEALQSEHPRSSLVALHRGLALYWARRNAEALTAWRAAASDEPDTPYAVHAGDLLHPQFAFGLPRFVPSFRSPAGIRTLPAPQQLAALRHAAAGGGAHARILYGIALQQLGRPVSAERQFAAAARRAPSDPEARAATAVGLFDKANPSRAFSRLGPLTRVFPHAQTVRFHLGLMLVWSAQVKEARRQFRLAEREDPRSALGKQANQYLRALGNVRTH